MAQYWPYSVAPEVVSCARAVDPDAATAATSHTVIFLTIVMFTPVTEGVEAPDALTNSERHPTSGMPGCYTGPGRPQTALFPPPHPPAGEVLGRHAIDIILWSS